MKTNGFVVPEHVRKSQQAQMVEQQMLAAARGEIQRLRLSIAKEIFEPLARARFNSFAGTDKDVDLNEEARYAIGAANFLLHHAGLLKQLEELEKVQGQQSPEAGKPSIIT